MNYDFTTVVKRDKFLSVKWLLMKKADPDVPEGIVPFSVADMELKNAPEITEGLKEFLDGGILGYGFESSDYLAAVCGWMERRHHWKVDPRWVVTSPGVIPALYHAVRAFTDPGDGVLVLTPVYYPFFAAIRDPGRKIAACPLLDRGARYEIDFERLETLAKDSNNKLLIFSSPHNPVGRVWTRTELERVAEICLRNDVFVVADEIHHDILLPGHVHTVFGTLSQEIARNSMVCTAPSKTFNLAGMQTSNIMIPDAERRAKFRQTAQLSGIRAVTVLGYRACELAYTRAEAWFDAFLELLDKNRRRSETFFRENLPEIVPYPLEGTYLQWLDFRALGRSPEALEDFLVRKARWFIDSGADFGKPGEGFVRFNLACPERVLQEALERLKAAYAN